MWSALEESGKSIDIRRVLENSYLISRLGTTEYLLGLIYILSL